MAPALEEALVSLLRTHHQGFSLSLDSLSTRLLQKCVPLKDLDYVRRVHCLTMSSTLQLSPVLGDHLIRLFSACGSLFEACLVFSQIFEPSSYTWQAIISCHITHEEHDAACEFYHDMHFHGTVPNKFIYPCILQACGGVGALEEGRLVHDHILRDVVDSVVLVGNTLIDMYTKCGSLRDAQKVFDDMQNKDVVTWGSIIAGYSQHGDGFVALELFRRMQQVGIPPNKVSFLSILKACGRILALTEGRFIHEQIIRAHADVDILVGNTLTDMYAKCGSLEDANKVLQVLENRTVSSWNAMIGGYAHYGAIEPAMELYYKMQYEGTSPDTVTYACLLTACGSKGSLEEGKLLHELITCTGFDHNEFVGNSLIDMYGKCGSVGEARQVFDSLPRQNSVSWGAMFAGYAQHEYGNQALNLFRDMIQRNVRTDEIVLSCVLKASSSINGWDAGNVIHHYVVSQELDRDLVVGNTLVDMYVKLGSMDDAHGVFDQLANPNVMSWGAILAGCAQHEQGQPAFDFFQKMLLKGAKPDDAAFACVVKACGSDGLIEQGRWVHEQIFKAGLAVDVAVGNALLDMYTNCDVLEDARKVFDAMLLRDVVSWNIMFTASAQSGHTILVLDLFRKMQRDGIQPNQVTFLVLLQVCGDSGALARVKHIHSYIVEAGLASDLVLGNSLIDTYGKCGSTSDAANIFDSMLLRDQVSWGAIIARYTQHGDHQAALQRFDTMQEQGVKPNDMIYTSVLSACSHAGEVEKGRLYFRFMKDLGITPTVEHYNCMIDLLGRAGFVKEAKQLLESMPISPDASGWMSLLNSSKAYAEAGLAKECLEQIILLDEDVSSGYTLMSGLYAEMDEWEEVEKLVGYRQSSLRKKSGAALSQINNHAQEFVMGETHPQSEIMDSLLRQSKWAPDSKEYVPLLSLSLELASSKQKEMETNSSVPKLIQTKSLNIC